MCLRPSHDNTGTDVRARDRRAVMEEPYHLEAAARSGGFEGEGGGRGRILQCTHSCLAVEGRLGALSVEVLACIRVWWGAA